MQNLSKNEIKQLSKLKQKKFRKTEEKVIVEGMRLVEELVRQNVEIDKILITEIDERINLILQKSKSEIFEVAAHQLQKLCSSKNNQNIAAIVPLPHFKILNFNRLLYLDNIADPGNMGTIIRTAVAADLDGIIVSPDCVDIYNDKCIRASMGAVFFLPIMTKEYNWLEDFDGEIFLADLADESIDFSQINVKDKKSVLVIGSEAHGIRKEIMQIAHTKIKIPMSSKIESLNAAVSTGILISQIFGFGGDR